MWETIKNALAGIKDASGIEIPGLPVDLGSLGESADTAVQSATESANGVVVGGATSVAEAAPAAIDSAAQALPDITLGAIGDRLPK